MKIDTSLLVLFVIGSCQVVVESGKPPPQNYLHTDDICFHEGTECKLAPEYCCNGLFCDDTTLKCTECYSIGESCESDENCCSGLTCSSGTCEAPTPIPCLHRDFDCAMEPEKCCEGRTCVCDVFLRWTCQ